MARPIAIGCLERHPLESADRRRRRQRQESAMPSNAAKAAPRCLTAARRVSTENDSIALSGSATRWDSGSTDMEFSRSV